MVRLFVKPFKFVLLLSLLILLPAYVIGCGGGNGEKPREAAEGQIQQPSASKEPEPVKPDGGDEAAQSPMNIVDMPKQIVVAKDEQTNEAQRTEPPLQDTVPNDIPILDNAQNTTALKLGEGIQSGEPYYQVSFQVSESAEETAERYRELLKGKDMDIQEDKEEDGAHMFKVHTAAWDVAIMIVRFMDHTMVSINYAKK